MAAQPWPAGVPDCFQRGSFARVEDPDITIRTEVSTGPAKTRSRYTTGIAQYSGAIVMKREEYNLYLDWFLGPLANGANPFITNDPISETDQVFRYLTPPSAVFVGANDFSVTMSFEQMPDP
jgi:hypothetical protein